jgi:mannose-6-phosphate isomerase-like protein (cupin superfamily)
MAGPTITAWSGSVSPDEGALRARMKAEGLSPYAWGNIPKDRYSPHVHAYDKVIYVVEGSITFILPGTGEELRLYAGDRLDLPAGVEHAAIVGAEGVSCLEAHNAGSSKL